MISIVVTIITLLLVIRFISKISPLHSIIRCYRSFEDQCHAHLFYKVPQHNENFQQNQIYLKVSTYLNSLPSLEDSDFTNLFTGSESNDILLHIDTNQTINDKFLGAKVSWKNEGSEINGRRTFVLKLRRNDKRRILRPYMQHILSVADDIEQRNRDIRLYMNVDSGDNGRWRSVPFTHPATFDTVVMDGDLKNKVKSDLELFLKSKQYYHRLGRVWKRSYLLYGPSGTGKSSFVAAMARFLCYDVYDIDMGNVRDDSDLKMLLLQTTPRSMVVVEDLDRFLMERSRGVISLPGLLNFMDGIISCCGEERVMVFTMKGKDQVDEAIFRPGRIDVHVQFPLCDFSAFKSLASTCLGVKEHKLFSQVEEIFQSGACLSPAQISEIMVSNRSSPNRALKSVITALQTIGAQGLSETRPVRSVDEAADSRSLFCRESVHTVREFGKLYGLLRMGSRRKESLDLGPIDKELGSRHEK
ncbi:AAA domain-containing protein/AAA_assoc domain-containing protein [Cephalotus follicularis]|uniref:AAA domain-containing protein/AAA_assoc domain-containing protein n=1 Tax=Cephalotus follicularis TaxID=3775 RepID=A0A1Q3DAY9_CEPFO|nr:AAA domain-containing protein/AAA_assoc domain-containing protein [Cephalotus follicularis]